jgi:hypothetical protein
MQYFINTWKGNWNSKTIQTGKSKEAISYKANPWILQTSLINPNPLSIWCPDVGGSDPLVNKHLCVLPSNPSNLVTVLFLHKHCSLTFLLLPL